MGPTRHLALSAAAGGVIWAATGKPWSLPVVLTAGVLVDVDHVVDLWWTFGRRRGPIATLALHGWEWLAGLIIAGIITGFSWWLTAPIVGYGLHLYTDHLFNGGRRRSYSIMFRASQGFNLTKVAPEWDLGRSYEEFQDELPWAAGLVRRWIPGPSSPQAAGEPGRVKLPPQVI